MTCIPAHKQTNPVHAPGQVVNPVPKQQQQPVFPAPRAERTLHDYIKRIGG